MKIKLLILWLAVIIPCLLYASDLRLASNSFSYTLSGEWKAFQSDSTAGTRSVWFKRNSITDSKQVEVIPNLGIQIFKINSDMYSDKKTDERLDIMITTLLLNNAPPEVLGEYQASKTDSIIFKIPYEPSYGFLSLYKDNYGDIHDCYYITLMKEGTAGAFIIIDCTKEIFPQINKEVQDFLNSLSFK